MEPFFYRNPYTYYSSNRFGYSPYRNNTYYNRAKSNLNQTNTYEKISSSEKEASSKENPKDIPSEKAIFEIFGIKLFFDDILLISLIFFLYSEGVKDQSLFIALILLLLS